jgi:hypothetical protein
MADKTYSARVLPVERQNKKNYRAAKIKNPARFGPARPSGRFSDASLHEPMEPPGPSI